MRRTPVLVNWLMAACLAAVTGCGTGGDEASTTTTTEAVEATSTTSEPTSTTGPTDSGDDSMGGDCPPTADLETVIGGPVEVSSTGGTSFSGGFETSVVFTYVGCEAYLAEGGQGNLSVARIDSAEVDGVEVDGSVYSRLRDAALADFEESGFEVLAELGAEAYRDGSEVVFLSGEAMVSVEVEIGGEESVDAALAVAAALISSGETLPTRRPDCEVLAAIAAEGVGEVSEAGISGGSTIIGDLQFETSGCRVEHVSGDETSIDVTDASVWADWIAEKEASVFSASYVEHQIAGRDAFDDGERLFVDDGDSPWMIEASGDDLDPDPAAVRLSLAELVLGR